MFESSYILWWALPLVVGLMLLLFARKREGSMKSQFAALWLRSMIILAALVIAAHPMIERDVPSKEPIIAYAVNADETSVLQSKAFAESPSVIEGQAPEDIDAWLVPKISGEHKPPYARLWLSRESAGRAKALLEAAEIPHQIMTFDVPSKLKVPDDNGEPEPAALVAASLPLMVSIPATLDRDQKLKASIRLDPNTKLKLRVLIDFNLHEVRKEGEGLYTIEALLAPGRHAFRAEALDDRGEAKHFVDRSVLVHKTRAPIGVISSKPATRQTVRALFPNYDVFALDIEELPKTETLRQARAVIYPLDEHPDPGEKMILRLRHYMDRGGVVLFTGLADPHLRSFPKLAIAEELQDILPVSFAKPKEPDFTLPKDDPKKDPPEKKGPKSETKEVEATVGKVSVLFLIDHSGSMVGERWVQTSAALNGALERIKSYDRAGVMLFTDETRWIGGTGMQEVSPSTAKSFRQALAKNAPKQASKTLLATSTTKALDALEKEKNAVRLLVVISDGIEEIVPGVYEPDYDAIRRRAQKKDITLVTLRVDAGGAEDVTSRKADERMKAIATDAGYAYAVTEEREKREVPKLVLETVTLAYRLYDAKEAAAKRKKEEEDIKRAAEEAKRKAAEEAKRAANEEAARLAREEEARKREEAWRKEQEKLLIPLEKFLDGTTEVTANAEGESLFGRKSLPPIGEHLAKTYKTFRGIPLASFEEDRLAICYQRWGWGGALFFAAPLDARYAGSWLAQPNVAAEILDGAVRGLARPTPTEDPVISALRAEPGRVLFRASANELQYLRAAGITKDGRALALNIKGHEDLAEVATDINIVKVELYESEGLLLAAIPTLPVVEAKEITKGLARPHFIDDEAMIFTPPEEIRVRAPNRDTWIWVILAFIPVALLIERFLRRQ